MKSIIAQRNIPALPEFKDKDEFRRELLDILAREEYGRPLPRPDKVSFKVIAREGANENNYLACKATYEEIEVTSELLGSSFTFPFKFVHREGVMGQKVIIQLNFRPLCPDRYTPVEEIIDRGYSVAMVDYNDITRDNKDFTSGVAGLLFPDGVRHNPDDSGKIMMWAWGASRIADYMETLDYVDMKYLAVDGHSRLGKTALVAGAYDDRFKFVHSNDSGCGGGAIFRDKRGEKIENITKAFPFWFCPKFESYVNKEHDLPFDQHYLVAAIAPRFVEIGCAVKDVWADHESEYLTAICASPAFEKAGVSGFVHPDRFPELDEHMTDGNIAYYVREGGHFFSRYDWNKFMDFIDIKTKE